MGGMRVKRMLWLLLCLAALLTACGQKTAAQAEPAIDPAVAAAQRYQSMVQAVGDGTRAGVDLTDAQIAQAVAQLSDAGLTAVHVDAADPVTHPETVTAFWDARAAGQTAEAALYEVCRDGGNLGARQAMLAASYQAGFAFTRAGRLARRGVFRQLHRYVCRHVPDARRRAADVCL